MPVDKSKNRFLHENRPKTIATKWNRTEKIRKSNEVKVWVEIFLKLSYTPKIYDQKLWPRKPSDLNDHDCKNWNTRQPSSYEPKKYMYKVVVDCPSDFILHLKCIKWIKPNSSLSENTFHNYHLLLIDRVEFGKRSAASN